MNDLISRQAAIDFIDAGRLCNPNEPRWSDNEIVNFLKSRPSAQQEIIRCKDCKWWDKSEDSPVGYCMAAKHGYISAHWEIGIYRTYKGDFFCADAEAAQED